MYILIDLWASIGGVLRNILLIIDSIGLTFIDNAYELLIGAISAFKQTAIDEIVDSITKNCYIIIGIFALFRIALLLVNSIINPDKLTEKKNGIGNVLANLVITIVLLVAVPFVFDLSRDLQGEIIDNNYISKLLIGQELVGDNANGTVNPGTQIKDIAVRALIYPDDRISEKDGDKYKGKGDCDQDCENAIKAWNNDVSISTLEDNIAKFTKSGDKNIYVYHYVPFITLLVGGFITYVLFSFAIDIAVRSVELIVLEILSPLFIVTYIDPKSSASGPFKKWLSTCGKTYVSLFIKIGIVCIMLLFVGNLNNIFDATSGGGIMLKLLVLMAILIFAKKAPKWLGDMLGVEGGLGGLGIGKKLAGAALVGGMIGKGNEAIKKWGNQKGKNFVGNRLRNTAARIGGMKEAHDKNKTAKKDGAYNKSNRASLWGYGRAAAKQSRSDNWGKNTENLLNAAATGYMAGRLNVNPEAKGLKDKLATRIEKDAKDYNDRIGNTAAAKATAQEIAKNNKEAKKMYGTIDTKTIDGDREKVLNVDGKEVYVQPTGKKEMNEAFRNPISEFSAYESYGTNLANHKGYTVNSSGQVLDGKNVIANSVAEFGMENMTFSGKLAIKSLVADNVKDVVQRYQSSSQNLQTESSNYTKAVSEYNNVIKDFNSEPTVISANNQITKYEELTTKLEEARKKYESIQKDTDYVALQQKDYSSLTAEEQTRLARYNVESKNLLNQFNTTQSQMKAEQKAYDNAVRIITDEKTSRGISQMETNIQESRRRVEAWAKAVKDMESKINDATEVISIDDKGAIEKDSSGNVIKKKISDLYRVKINGETLSPIDDFIRIEEIKAELNRKSEKAKSKYEESIADKNDDKK